MDVPSTANRPEPVNCNAKYYTSLVRNHKYQVYFKALMSWWVGVGVGGGGGGVAGKGRESCVSYIPNAIIWISQSNVWLLFPSLSNDHRNGHGFQSATNNVVL